MNDGHELRARGFPIRYLLVFFLLVLSAIAFLDRTNLSVAGIQISREFRIDNAHLGWVISAFLIGYALFQVPAGLLIHRFGSRLVLTFAVLWWGVFTVLAAVIPPSMGGALLTLVMVRFALGAGEATMYPATSQFIAHWFPPRERGRANGIIFAGVGIGSGFTPPIVTFIILHYGWRASFWFSAAVGVLGGMAWYIAARDRPEQHPLVSRAELALITGGREFTAQGGASARGQKRAVPWRRILGSREIIALTLSYFSLGYVAWIFFGWFYIYLAQVRGLNLKASAVYSMLPFIGITVGCLVGGTLSDWIAVRFSQRLGRSILPAAGFLLTAVFLVLGSRAERAESASLILALGAGMLYLSQAPFWAVATNFAGEYAGVATGVMNMGAQIGGACTASVTPVIAAHFGWEVSFATAAGLALLGAVAWLFVDPERRLVPSAVPAAVAAD